MSTAVVTAGEVGAAPERRPAVRRKRRWHRAAIPFTVAIVLIVFTFVAHAMEQPDFGDPGTLSPTGTGPDGSSRLAALLAEREVTVERVTSSASAVQSAVRGGATVFVPHADFPNPYFLSVLAALPVQTRVVVVAPGANDQYDLPIATTGGRWAAQAVDPGCGLAEATGAGRATARHLTYRTRSRLGDRFSCYGDGLVGGRWDRIDLTVIGATDPFRNSRIAEYGNAELATGLLSTTDRLIWLDLHRAEPVSTSFVDDPNGTVNDPGEEDIAEPEAPGNPIWTAVPPAFWAILVQLALVAVLLALWRARRLGPPVPEPLPVLVPAAETVTGRGQLYLRAHARPAAMNALRTAAVHRILPALDLPPDTPQAQVTAAVAARSGAPPEYVRELLYGPEPETDDQLTAQAAALDALVFQVTREMRRTSR